MATGHSIPIPEEGWADAKSLEGERIKHGTELIVSLRLVGSLHMGAHGIRPLEGCRHVITWDTDI